MIILYKKKELININSIDDLEKFIIEYKLYKYFKKIHDTHITDVINAINNTEKLNFKEIKIWLKKILKYPNSLYDFNFLKCMGWDDNDIINFIIEKQKNNANIISEKKNKNPELYYSATTCRIEYWLSKGYSINDAKEKLHNRQLTFSKKKCVEKYGYNDGINRFNQRQKKWVTSLNKNPNYNEIQKLKNSYDYS